MRRRLLKLLSLALLTGLTATIGYGQIATPPVVDGDPSDAIWSSATTMEVLRENTVTGITDTDDFSATIRTLWDADAIYVLLEVMDDTLITDLLNPWDRDHYSIYFDFGNHKSTINLMDTDETKDSVQFMLEKVWSVEEDHDFQNQNGSFDSVLVWNVDFVEDIDSGSMYVLEMAIPMEDLGVALAADMMVGFDVKVGDNDGTVLDGKLSLYQSEDEGWRNPSYLGTAILQGDGSFAQVKHKPMIDGEADYAWNEAQKFALEVDNGNTGVDDDTDFSGTVAAMWDEDNIYVLLEVVDDTLITDLLNPWDRDHYSVYFDFGNYKSTSHLIDMDETKDSVQFMLEKVWSVEEDHDFQNQTGSFDSVLVWGVDFVEKIDTGEMYTLEMAIPLEKLGVTFEAGDVLGFDTKIGDNDGTVLDGKYSWNQRLDESWQNPSYMGNVEVVDPFFDLGTFAWAPPQIVIDGEKDGDYNQGVPMQIERENDVTGVEDDDDFSGTITALWNTENIHIWLEVMDDTLITDLLNPWDRDHYSIYFDFGNYKSETHLMDTDETKDSVQFMLEKVWSVEEDHDFQNQTGSFDTVLVWGVDFVETIDSGSMYTLEMVIPLDLLGVELAADQVIGFDAKIGDNDGTVLDGKLSWNQFADESWQNPSYMGEVTLMGNGTFYGMPMTPKQTVTINVDMTGMIEAKAFDAAADFLDIAGTMNEWGDPVMQADDADGDGIYTIVLADQEVGAELEYKFRVNGAWDPISEFPGGGPNRMYTVIEATDVLENVIDIVFNDGDYTPWIVEGMDVDRASLIHIYPNPASSTLNIRNVGEISTIELVNLLGQVTYRQLNSGNSSVVMPLDGQKSGIYMIRFTDTNSNVSLKKLIIE